MTTEPGAKSLLAAARDELMYLWSDLQQARLHAHPPGVWSMNCIAIADRIKALTPHVGPTPWEKVPTYLVLEGIYQRLHEEMGIKVTWDMERVHEHIKKIDPEGVGAIDAM